MKIDLFFGGGKLRGTKIPVTPSLATALSMEGVSIQNSMIQGGNIIMVRLRKLQNLRLEELRTKILFTTKYTKEHKGKRVVKKKNRCLTVI